jgi:tetratricopeptide (TPR) repeat protein
MQGIASTDTGRYDDAETQFHESLRIAERDGVEQVTAWSSSFLGRLHLLRDDLARARQHLTTGLEVAGALRWTAFTPRPETLLADVDIREGRLDDAAAAYEHALALALQFDDPCWEGLAARGLGLVAAHDSRPRDAYDWLDRARTRCVRLPDAYLWVEGYCLDALCDLAIEHHFLDAGSAVADLEALATRTGMRQLVARAVGYRARLGDRAAADSQRTFIAELST